MFKIFLFRIRKTAKNSNSPRLRTIPYSFPTIAHIDAMREGGICFIVNQLLRETRGFVRLRGMWRRSATRLAQFLDSTYFCSSK
jgi:hypothetical protein